MWLRRYEEEGGGWVPNQIAGTTGPDGRWRIDDVRLVYDVRPTTTPEERIDLPISLSRAPATVPKIEHTAFLAVMMAAGNAQNYRQHHHQAKRVCEGLQKHCGLKKVFCPAAEIASSKTLIRQTALQEGLSRIRACDFFILIYSTKLPSSILVEAGFALALYKPSLLFCSREDRTTLPSSGRWSGLH